MATITNRISRPSINSAQVPPSCPEGQGFMGSLIHIIEPFLAPSICEPGKAELASGTSVALSTFAFGSTQLRIIAQDGSLLFHAGDVCNILGLGNPRQALARLDEDEKGVQMMDTPGGPQKVNVINESGLYTLIMRSHKPKAKEFRRWVTGEVLPAIRQTGAYQVQGNPSSSVQSGGSRQNLVPKWPDLLGATAHLTYAVHILMGAISSSPTKEPQISASTRDLFARIIAAAQFTTLDEVARLLGMKKVGLYRALREKGVLGTGAERNRPSEFSLTHKILAYQTLARMGSDGGTRRTKRTVVTPFGLVFLAEGVCMGMLDEAMGGEGSH